MELLENAINQAKSLKGSAERQKNIVEENEPEGSYVLGYKKGVCWAYEVMLDYMEDLLKNSESVSSDQG